MIRQRFFTFLNLTGLATGIAAFLLIYLFVSDELSYDKFHTNSERIYRVNMTNIWIENEEIFGSTSPAVVSALKNDIPEIENAIRLHEPSSEELISIPLPNGDFRSYQEDRILASDDGFFDLFTFPMIEGNPKAALSSPNSVVLSESTAKKYFGDQPAIGQQLLYGVKPNQKVLSVTGVIEDVPNQSHFTFDLLLSMSSFPYVIDRSDSWIWTGFVTYALLNPASDLAQVNNKLASLPAKYVGDARAQEKNWILALHNIEDIRLYSGDISNRIGPIGDIDNVIIFSTVALVILLLSCINFMNLSTAKFTNRAKEIGLQKVLGSSKSQIRVQFLTESISYCLIAAIIGFGLAEITRPFFNQLASKELSLNLFEKPELILLLLGIILSTGLLSGVYPAWFMTRFNLTDAVRGKLSKTGSKARMRNLLVVLQFTISTTLISSSFLVANQLDFLQQRDLGFDEEHVLVIPHLEWMQDQGKLFKDQALSRGLFQNAAVSNSVPPNSWFQDNLQPLNSSKTTELPVTMINGEAEFVDVLELQILAGRSFFSSGEGDADKVIINEQCAIRMEWLKPGEDPEQVLGKEMTYYGEGPFQVVGVLRDFNFWALYNPVEPMALFHPTANVWQGNLRYLVAKIKQQDMDGYQEVLAGTEKLWNELNPNLPFDYQFMDQAFDSAFTSQRRFGNVLNVFSVLAILIAVLGLIGLIAFTTEQKTKEFGIRKVLGANLAHLIKLGTLDFIKLLGIALVLGSVFTWYFGKSWLQNFAYQSAISPSIFIIAAGVILALILVIAWTIIGQTARKNPALILRDD